MPTSTNERIAREVMGWITKIDRFDHLVRKGLLEEMEGWDCWEEVPDFEGDLNAVALAEQEIERRGLWADYRDALLDVEMSIPADDRPSTANFLIRLTPAQRCKAMLAVVAKESAHV